MKINGPKNLIDYLANRIPLVMQATPDVVFNILTNDPRSINFNEQFTQLNISASGIDNLSDNYNKIGLLQSFYRFVGLNAVASGFFLMHASGAKFNGRAVAFGDNGKAVGKTLSSIEMGLISKEYIGDEFIFFDLDKLNIFTDQLIPIHLRPEVRDHLKNIHNISTRDEFVSEQELSMKSVNNQRLDALCYLNFITDPSLERISRLNTNDAEQYALITLSAHTKKMLDPSLDRFQFIAKTDSSATRDVVSGVNDKHYDFYSKIENYFNNAAKIIANNVPSYELFVVSPCSVSKLLNEVIN